MILWLFLWLFLKKKNRVYCCFVCFPIPPKDRSCLEEWKNNTKCSVLTDFFKKMLNTKMCGLGKTRTAENKKWDISCCADPARNEATGSGMFRHSFDSEAERGCLKRGQRKKNQTIGWRRRTCTEIKQQDWKLKERKNGRRVWGETFFNKPKVLTLQPCIKIGVRLVVIKKL